MAGRVVLDDIIESVKRSRRGLTKARVREGIGLALRLLPSVLLRRPGLAPLQEALEGLLQPSRGSNQRERLMARMRRLRGKLKQATTSGEEMRLRGQIDLLYELLRGND